MEVLITYRYLTNYKPFPMFLSDGGVGGVLVLWNIIVNIYFIILHRKMTKKTNISLRVHAKKDNHVYEFQ